MYRRSSFRNSSTTGDLIIKRSTTAPKPIEVATTATAATPPLPLLPRSQSTKVTQRSHSHSHRLGNREYDHQNQQEPLQKKAAEPIIEFPVSPDADALLLGEGITNANHPQHRMVHVNLPNPFNCMGCKEYGAGPRFTCQQCNFELHDFCALAPPVLKAHPLHSQHQLVFASKPGINYYIY